MLDGCRAPRGGGAFSGLAINHMDALRFQMLSRLGYVSSPENSRSNIAKIMKPEALPLVGLFFDLDEQQGNEVVDLSHMRFQFLLHLMRPTADVRQSNQPSALPSS